MNRHFQVLASVITLVLVVMAAWVHRSYFSQPAYAAQIDQAVEPEHSTQWRSPNDHSSPLLIEQANDQPMPEDFLSVQHRGQITFQNDKEKPWPFAHISKSEEKEIPPAIDSKYRPLIPFREQTKQLPTKSEQIAVAGRTKNQLVRASNRFMYKTKPGDSLPSLATRFLGSADRYLELYAINSGHLPNAVTLPAGTTLWIPGTNSETKGFAFNENSTNSAARQRLTEIE